MVQIVKRNNEFTFTNTIQGSTWHVLIRDKLGIIKINSTNILGMD